MKIFERDSVNIGKPQSGRTEQTAPAKVRTPATTRRSVGEDQVEVSAQSQLQTLATSIGEESRTHRVEQLRALVQSGNYKVDNGALSDSIVASMLQGG